MCSFLIGLRKHTPWQLNTHMILHKTHNYFEYHYKGHGKPEYHTWKTPALSVRQQYQRHESESECSPRRCQEKSRATMIRGLFTITTSVSVNIYL